MWLGVFLIKIAIIGSGVSALAAAHLLKDYAHVRLFEKSRGVGGRMSTRRVDSYIFDHGAQYFTARTKPFKAFIRSVIDQGLLMRWDANYVKFDGDRIIDRQNWIDDEPRYISPYGINQVAKFFAKDIEINLNTKIVRCIWQDKWILFDEMGKRFDGFDWVISTVPAPQAVEVIPRAFGFYDEVSNVDMQGCISLGLGFRQNPLLDFDCAHVRNSSISWLAKRFYQDAHGGFFSVIVHSSQNFAREYLNGNQDDPIGCLKAELLDKFNLDAGLSDCENLQVWRFSHCDKTAPNKVFLDSDLHFAVCGDWMSSGRVEGAFISAYNLVDGLLKSGL